ncbi:hypothetical protein Tco_0647973 [Tanacetum coccineum]
MIRCGVGGCRRYGGGRAKWFIGTGCGWGPGLNCVRETEELVVLTEIGGREDGITVENDVEYWIKSGRDIIHGHSLALYCILRLSGASLGQDLLKTKHWFYDVATVVGHIDTLGKACRILAIDLLLTKRSG